MSVNGWPDEDDEEDTSDIALQISEVLSLQAEIVDLRRRVTVAELELSILRASRPWDSIEAHMIHHPQHGWFYPLQGIGHSRDWGFYQIERLIEDRERQKEQWWSRVMYGFSPVYSSGWT